MRLHATFSMELDELALERYRDQLVARGEVLYDKELGRLWPGRPDEWTSITDVIDLIEQNIIVRTELVEVRDGPAPWTPAGSTLRGWRRFIPFFVVLVVALAIASSGSSATIIGTSGPDRLIGTWASDVIRGKAGNDLMRGRPGDDALLGGRGADYIIGGRGHDYIEAGRGDDSIDTQDGAFDLIQSCGPGLDVVLRDAFDFVALDCEVSDLGPDPAP